MVFTLTNRCWKQKSVKGVLKQLNRENFSNIKVRILEKNSLLCDVQVRALRTPTPHLFDEERQLHQKWLFLRQIEECYIRQKSRVNWLNEGHQNTAYFFRIFQTRASYNTIQSFMMSSGVLLTDPLLMSRHAVIHFRNLLGPDLLQPPHIPSTQDWFTQLSGFSPSPTYIIAMTMIPTAEELQELQSLSDFRPISCLNTLYKVIARLLARRIKPILPELIVPNQTSFIKGRLIVENTVLAGELVNGYHRKTGPKRITIKVDIAKASDTLSCYSVALKVSISRHFRLVGLEHASVHLSSPLATTVECMDTSRVSED